LSGDHNGPRHHHHRVQAQDAVKGEDERWLRRKGAPRDEDEQIQGDPKQRGGGGDDEGGQPLADIELQVAYGGRQQRLQGPPFLLPHEGLQRDDETDRQGQEAGRQGQERQQAFRHQLGAELGHVAGRGFRGEQGQHRKDEQEQGQGRDQPPVPQDVQQIPPEDHPRSPQPALTSLSQIPEPHPLVHERHACSPSNWATGSGEAGGAAPFRMRR